MCFYRLWSKRVDNITAQKMKLSIQDFLSKFDQIHRKLPIWSHLLKKSLMENPFFLYSTFSEVKL